MPRKSRRRPFFGVFFCNIQASPETVMSLIKLDVGSAGREILSQEPFGEHLEGLRRSELRDHVSGASDGDEAEVVGVNGLETSQLVALVHPRLPQGQGRGSHQARGPVLRTSEGHRSVHVSAVDEHAHVVR